jgi:hypothetical protein
VKVKASRINHSRIGVRPVGTQTVNPANVDTRVYMQYGPVRDDIVIDTHISEAWTAIPADTYAGRVNLVEDVIGDVGVRDGHPVVDDDRPLLARVLIAESERVVNNIHPRAGFRVCLNRPPLLDIVEDIVTDSNIVARAVVDAVIVVLIVIIGWVASVLPGCETADVVDDVAFNQNVALLDINAHLSVAGIGADSTDVMDAVADDFRESAAAIHLDSGPAATGVGHAIDLEVLDANVIGASEGETGAGVILSVELGAPLVARFEGHQFARLPAASEADNRLATRVGTAISINAVLDNHGTPRSDSVSRLLDGAEGLTLCAGVGVRA